MFLQALWGILIHMQIQETLAGPFSGQAVIHAPQQHPKAAEPDFAFLRSPSYGFAHENLRTWYSLTGPQATVYVRITSGHLLSRF